MEGRYVPAVLKSDSEQTMLTFANIDALPFAQFD
jgi:hypothetical protein